MALPFDDTDAEPAAPSLEAVAAKYGAVEEPEGQSPQSLLDIASKYGATVEDDVAPPTKTKKPKAGQLSLSFEDIAKKYGAVEEVPEQTVPGAQPTAITMGGKPYAEGQFTPLETEVIGQSPAAQAAAGPPSLKQPPIPAPVNPPEPPLGRLGSAKTGGVAIEPPMGQGVLDLPVAQGVRQFGKGITESVGAGTQPVAPSTRLGSAKTGGMATEGQGGFEANLNAASDLIEGALKTASPLAVVGAITAPVSTAIGAVVAMSAGDRAAYLAKLANGTPAEQRFAKNIVEALAFAATAKVVRGKIAEEGASARAQMAADEAAAAEAHQGFENAKPVGRGVAGRILENPETGRPGLPPAPDEDALAGFRKPEPPSGPPAPSGASATPAVPPTELTRAQRDSLPTMSLPTLQAAMTRTKSEVDSLLERQAQVDKLSPGASTSPEMRAKLPLADRLAFEQLPNRMAYLEALDNELTRRASVTSVHPDEIAAVTEEPARDYASTQVNLPDDDAQAVKAFAEKYINKRDRISIEDTPHITVKYGIHSHEAIDAIRDALKDEGPIEVTLGKTSHFDDVDGGKADAVIATVDSPDLHRLNKLIADAVPHTDTYPEYVPHVTLGYVKPGTGKDYDGYEGLRGRKITLNSIMFSGKGDDQQTAIPLTGKGVGAKGVSATFLGYQQDAAGGTFPVYNVVGGPYDRSTVSVDRLKALGIVPPATPSLEDWKKTRQTPESKALNEQFGPKPGQPTKTEAPKTTEPEKPSRAAKTFEPTWMNEGEIEQAVERFKDHPVLGPAARFLHEFMEETNRHSDGWPYWKQASHAAGRLQGLLHAHLRAGMGAYPKQEEPIAADVQATMGPIKAFMKKRGEKAGMKMPALDLAERPQNATSKRQQAPNSEANAPGKVQVEGGTPTGRPSERIITVAGRRYIEQVPPSKDYPPQPVPEDMEAARKELADETAGYSELATNKIHDKLDELSKRTTRWKKYGQPTAEDYVRENALTDVLVKRRQEKQKKDEEKAAKAKKPEVEPEAEPDEEDLEGYDAIAKEGHFFEDDLDDDGHIEIEPPTKEWIRGASTKALKGVLEAYRDNEKPRSEEHEAAVEHIEHVLNRRAADEAGQGDLLTVTADDIAEVLPEEEEQSDINAQSAVEKAKATIAEAGDVDEIEEETGPRRNAIGSNALEKALSPKAQDALAKMFKARNKSRDLRHIREAMEVYDRLIEGGHTGDAIGEAGYLLRAADGFFTRQSRENADHLDHATFEGLKTITGEEDPDPAELLENEVFASAQEAGRLIFDTLDPKTASFDVEEFNTAFGMVEFRRPQEKVFPKPTEIVNDHLKTLTEKEMELTGAAKAALVKEKGIISQSLADDMIAEWKAEAKRIGKDEDHSNETVLSLFDVTGQWSQPWKDAGYNVIRFDIKNGDDLMDFGKWMDVVEEEIAEGRTIVGILGAPPCTSFAVSGARWWKSQHDIPDTSMVAKKYGLWAADHFERPLDYANTLVAVMKLIVEQADPRDFYAMENPIGRIAEQNALPKPTLVFDPANFGNPYTKQTQIWGEFNPDLPMANVEPTLGSLMHKLRGDVEEDKAKRSETPEGFAYAFFMANHKKPETKKRTLEERNKGWTRPDAEAFLAAHEPALKAAGFTAEIVGGVSKRGESENDLDIVLRPIVTAKSLDERDEAEMTFNEHMAPSLGEDEIMLDWIRSTVHEPGDVLRVFVGDDWKVSKGGEDVRAVEFYLPDALYKGVESKKEESHAEEPSGGVDTGQLPERGQRTARTRGARGKGALGTVSAERGEQPEGAGAERAGRGDQEGVVADAVPDRTGAATEPVAEPDSGGERIEESASLPPAGDTHDPGHPSLDWVITPERVRSLIDRGPVKRAEDNLAAIKLIKQLAAEERYATVDEQEVLAKYVGWGATDMANRLADYPDPRWSGNEKRIWQELRDVLTDDEREKLRDSSPYAHFTYDLFGPMWKAVERAGFTGGRVLEPSVGTGHAFGLMPPDVRVASVLNGVELEPITAAIAHHLYPSAKIQPVGIEAARLARGTQDLIIGNPPFGGFGITDKRAPDYATHRIHGYFFWKALELARPGGLVMFIATHYMLDSQETQRLRMELMKQAEFVGAVRLPNTAFDKSAKTEVVTDIIVLRKLRDGEKAQNADLFTQAPLKPGLSVKAGYNNKTGRWQPDTNIYRSSWYDKHPELVLGAESTEGTMRGGGPEYTVTAHKGVELSKDLTAALGEILPPGSYTPMTDEPTAPGKKPSAPVVVEGAFKPGEYRVGEKKGTIIRVADDGSVSDATPKKKVKGSDKLVVDTVGVERMTGMIAIRDARKAVVEAMLNPTSTDAQIKTAQSKLTHAYDRFVKPSSANPNWLNNTTNKRLFSLDPESATLLGLEVIETKAELVVKDGKKVLKLSHNVVGRNEIFTKRTINAPREVTHADTPKDALLASLGVKGRLDWPYMAQLYNGSTSRAAVGTIKEKLKDEGLVFEQPDGSYVLAEEYLSGDVVTKLEDVEAAGEPKRFGRNIEALKSVQPRPKTPDDITAGLVSIGIGAHWVPPADLSAFIAEQLGVSPRNVTLALHGSEAMVRWDMTETHEAKAAASRHPLAVHYYNNHKVYSFLDLVRDALNVSMPDLGHMEGSGKNQVWVKEPEATLAARANQELLRQAWFDYVFAHPDLQDRLLGIYNERFNRIVERQYDGSHMKYPGMATLYNGAGEKIEFFPHQNRGVWRILTSGNTLLAHEVGAGKTFEMIAAAMEMRRTGRANKPMIVVPTYLLSQWRQDILKLYPSARLLAFDEKDLEKSKRQVAMSRIAHGNWDIVLVPHSSFQLLKVSDARMIKVMEGWRDELEAAQAEAEAQSGKKAASVKAMAQARRKIQDKIDKKAESLNKGTDNALTWEQLGVDALMIDEAQAFKNLFFFSKIQNMRGLSRSESDRSLDLFVKVQDINEQSGHRNLVLATATPVMNGIAEIFTMQRYLQPQVLRRYGVENFDNWYAMFAKALPTTERQPDGTYKEVMRLRDYQNLQTLSRMVREVMDYVGWEDMPYLKLPKIKGGSVRIIETEQHPMWPILQKWFEDRMYQLKLTPPHVVQSTGEYVAPERMDPITGEPMGRKDNILAVMTDAKKAAVDVRLVLGGRAKDWPGSRLQKAADEMVKVWKAEKDRKGVVLMFLDMGTPHEPPPLNFLKDVTTEDETEGENDEPTEEDDQMMAVDDGEEDIFNLYDALKQALVKRGVPANEIAYIHQARNAAERIALFQAANRGDVRFVFASTDKGGVGMNIQTRLAAIHEIDAPRAQRPGDLRQRMGRGIRQGNTYTEVELARYVTKGTTDEWLWGLLTTKDYQLRKFYRGEASNITEDDPSTMSLEEAQIRATGDPRGVELTELKGRMARLESQAAAGERAVGLARADVQSATTAIKHNTKDLEDLKAWLPTWKSKRGDAFEMTVGTQTFTKRAEADEALLKSLRAIVKNKVVDSTHVATIGGLRVLARDVSGVERKFKNEKSNERVEVPFHAVDLYLDETPLGAGSADIGRVQQKDYDKPETLGEGQNLITSIGNVYERIPQLQFTLEGAIEDAEKRLAQSERVLAHPPDAIQALKLARARVIALETELKAEGEAKDAARKAASTAATAPDPAGVDGLEAIPEGLTLAYDHTDLGIIYYNGSDGRKWYEAAGRYFTNKDSAQAYLDGPDGDGGGEGPQYERVESNVVPFFSALRRAVEAKMPKSAIGKHILAIVKNPQSGVKAEEAQWSGLEPWLAEHGDKPVSKAAVLAFLDQNEIHVNDVLLGRRNDAEAEAARAAFVAAAGPSAEELADEIERGQFDPALLDADLEPLGKRLKAVGGAGRQTKFESHVLPGGENYRELLLTLPTAMAPGYRVLEEEPGSGKWFVEFPDGKRVGTWLSRKAAEESQKRQPGAMNFTGGHFDEPNVLVHVRFDDRTDAQGRKVLFVEEVQSDWHQKGRKTGYDDGQHAIRLAEHNRKRDEILSRANALSEAAQAAIEKVDKLGFDSRSEAFRAIRTHPDWVERWDVKPRDDGKGSLFLSDQEIEAVNAYSRVTGELAALRDVAPVASANAVPDAPFKKTWHELAMKRMLRYAAEHGYDVLAWTPGDVQNERYDLSKSLDRIQWGTFTDPDDPNRRNVRSALLAVPYAKGARKEVVVYPKNGGNHSYEIYVTPDGAIVAVEGASAGIRQLVGHNLADAIGKDIADKILGEEFGKLSGDGLRLGGSGMRGFYDKILPDFMRKYTKPWGAAVGTMTVDVQGRPEAKEGLHTRYEYVGPNEITADDFRARAARDDSDLSRRAIGAAVAQQFREIAKAMDRGMSVAEAMLRHGSMAAAEAIGGQLIPLKQVDATVHSVEITPAMRQSVMEKGQPLFETARAASGNPDLVRQFEEAERAQQKADYDSIPVDSDTVPLYDTGRRLTAAESAQLAMNPDVQTLATTIQDVVDRIAADILGTERAGIERIGLLFDRDAHGVFFPDPTNQKGTARRAKILINPFERIVGGVSSPSEVAHYIFQTAVHEVTHWDVKGHGQNFLDALAANMARMENYRIIAWQRLRDAYGNTDGTERFREGLAEAVSIYQTATRREASTSDALSRKGGYAQRPSIEDNRPGGMVGRAEPDRARTAAKLAVRMTLDEVRGAGDGMRFLFAPDTRSSASKGGAATLRPHIAARDQKIAKAHRDTRAFERLMDGWSHDESMRFWDVLEGEAKLSTLDPQAQEIAKVYRDILDYWRGEVTRRGLIRKYIADYWPHEWVKEPGTLDKVIRRLFSRKPMQGPESYRKRRTIPTMREGIDEYHLQPVSWNPTTQLLRKITEMAKSVAAYDVKEDFKRNGFMKFVAEGRRGAMIRKGKLPKHWVEYPTEFVSTVYGPDAFPVKFEDEAMLDDEGEPTERTVIGKPTFGKLVAGRYYGPPEVVQIVKNHLSAGLWGKSALFDGYRRFGNFLNMVQLSWSAFHMWLTGMESIVSKQALVLDLIQRGEWAKAAKTQAEVGPQSIFIDLIRGHKALKEFYAKDADATSEALDDVLNQIIQGGGGFSWTSFEHENAPQKFMTALREALGAIQRFDMGTAAVKGGKAAVLAPFAAVELPTLGIMNAWVPRLKAAAYLEMAQMELQRLGPDAEIEDVRRVLGEAWDSIDNRFGQLRYDNLFWNNAFKHLSMASVRAVGWNVGSIREMFGAFPAQAGLIRDNVIAGGGSGGGAGVPPASGVAGDEAEPPEIPRLWLHRKMAWFLSMLWIYGLTGALYMYLMTGKRPQTIKDYFFPQDGTKDSQGKPRRRSVVGYFRDLYSWTTHPVTTAAHKAQSLLTILYEILTNEDYAGVEVHPEGSIPLLNLDDMKFVWQQFRPFSLSNAERTAESPMTDVQRFEHWLAQAVSATTPAPAVIERSKAETLLHDWGERDHRTKTREEAAHNALTRQVREGLKARTPEGREAAQEAMRSGDLTRRQTMAAVKAAASGQTFLQYGFQRQNLDRALQLYEVATPQERYRLKPLLMKKAQSQLLNAPANERRALFDRYRSALKLEAER